MEDTKILTYICDRDFKAKPIEIDKNVYDITTKIYQLLSGTKENTINISDDGFVVRDDKKSLAIGIIRGSQKYRITVEFID